MNAQTDAYRALQINPNIYGKAFPVKRKMKRRYKTQTSRPEIQGISPGIFHAILRDRNVPSIGGGV